MKWLDRLFGLEEINGGERCPTYLYRWTLLKWRDYGVYLHHFVGDDWALDLHDHPKRFISIGLRGQYLEETPGDAFPESHPKDARIAPCGCSILKVEAGLCDAYSNKSRIFRAPWIRTFPATHRHRLTMIDGGDCWTLVIVLKAVRDWGFWWRGTFIPWHVYVDSSIADSRKACR